MFLKGVFFAAVVAAVAANAGSMRASNSDLQVTADGEIRMVADQGTQLIVDNNDITMVLDGDSSKSMTVSQIASALADLTTMNDNLTATLAALKADYTATSTNVTDTKTRYALTNKAYIANLTAMQNTYNTWNSGTVQDLKTQYQSATSSFDGSSNKTTDVVGSLVSRYNALRDTRDFNRNSALNTINAAMADAQASLNNATADARTFASQSDSAVAARQNNLDAATKMLSDGVAAANTAVAAGNAQVTTSVKSITDLAADINRRLTASKVTSINAASLTLKNNVENLMEDLDDSFFSLEASVQNLRSYINNDFSKFDEIRYTPTEVDASDGFGLVADYTGDTVIAGATGFDRVRTRTGGAFIFTYNKTTNSFQPEATLEGERSFDSFGYTVSIDGDTALIGAPFHEPPRVAGSPFIFSSGAAYVYKKMDGDWKLSQKLEAPDRTSNDNFGRSVSIDGNRLVVTAPFHEVTGTGGPIKTNTGIVYLYERANPDANFIFVTTLSATGSGAFDNLGSLPNSVVIKGDYIACGASSAESDTSKSGHGEVYVWTLKALPGADGTLVTSWQSDGVLSPSSELDAFDSFGISVDMCIRNGQPIIAVGATGDDGANSSVIVSSSGAVYVYAASTTAGFDAPNIIRPEDPIRFSSFGIETSFDASCSRLAVASYGISRAGLVYTYNIGASGRASFINRVEPAQTSSSDNAGLGLVWGQDFVGFGASGNDDKGFGAGTFYALSSVDIV